LRAGLVRLTLAGVTDPEPSLNSRQIAHWNEVAGPTWADLAPLLDRQLGPVTRRALEALDPREGDRVLDVGCGCGRSSLDLAARVGPGGCVLGVDVSRPMLEIARARASGLANVRFAEVDASAQPFAEGSFDGLFSAFGVMFFADPLAAFRNLRQALAPGARVAFVCWRAASENPIMTYGMNAVRHRFPPPKPADPHAPGPFAFADGARTRSTLEAAGFQDVELRPHDGEMGGHSLEDTITLSLRVGPLATALREHPELAPIVQDELRSAFVKLVRAGEVWLPSALWIVTARQAAIP